MYTWGEYETLAEAVAECKRIIDDQLPKTFREGLTPEKLYEGFMMFGDEPYILAPDGYEWGPDDEDINAITYFKQRACEICGEPPESLDRLRKDPKYAKWFERWDQLRAEILRSDVALLLRPSTRSLLFRGE